MKCFRRFLCWPLPCACAVSCHVIVCADQRFMPFRFEPTKSLKSTVEHAALLVQQSRLKISEDDPESQQFMDRAQFANVRPVADFPLALIINLACQSQCQLLDQWPHVSIHRLVPRVSSLLHMHTCLAVALESGPSWLQRAFWWYRCCLTSSPKAELNSIKWLTILWQSPPRQLMMRLHLTCRAGSTSHLIANQCP